MPLLEPVDSHLQFVVGKSWVVTMSERRPAFFDEWIDADQGETLKGRMTATAFAAALLMRHFDVFREQIAEVDVAIDHLDETVLRSREKKSLLLTLAALRRRLSRLRVVLKDHRGVVPGLIGPDFLSHVAPSDRDFLVETNRLFERLEDDVGRARETVIGSFELYASRVAQDTNQLIKISHHRHRDYRDRRCRGRHLWDEFRHPDRPLGLGRVPDHHRLDGCFSGGHRGARPLASLGLTPMWFAAVTD